MRTAGSPDTRQRKATKKRYSWQTKVLMLLDIDLLHCYGFGVLITYQASNDRTATVSAVVPEDNEKKK